MIMCRANIKVSSTETGAIFGNIVYESTAYADRSVVVLNDIHIDIMDYISPASCPDVQFRSMWAEFEWENKVSDQSLPRAHATLTKSALNSTSAFQDMPLHADMQWADTPTINACATPMICEYAIGNQDTRNHA